MSGTLFFMLGNWVFLLSEFFSDLVWLLLSWENQKSRLLYHCSKMPKDQRSMLQLNRKCWHLWNLPAHTLPDVFLHVLDLTREPTRVFFPQRNWKIQWNLTTNASELENLPRVLQIEREREREDIQHALILRVNTLEHIAPKLRASVPAGHLADSQRAFLLLG